MKTRAITTVTTSERLKRGWAQPLANRLGLRLGLVRQCVDRPGSRGAADKGWDLSLSFFFFHSFQSPFLSPSLLFSNSSTRIWGTVHLFRDQLRLRSPSCGCISPKLEDFLVWTVWPVPYPMAWLRVWPGPGRDPVAIGVSHRQKGSRCRHEALH